MNRAGGAAVRVYKDPNNLQNPVTVTLMCSPKKPFPWGVAAKFVNDWVGSETFSGTGGGIGVPGVAPSYLHGDIADALRLSEFKGTQAIIDAIVGAGISLTSSLAISAIVCAASGIPTFGITCATAAAAIGGAFAAAIVGAVAAVAKDFVTAQANRYAAAASAKWFVWMSSWGMFWNSVAGVSDTAINPSMTNARCCSDTFVRIGVQFTSAPAGGGPDFSDIKSDGTLTAKAQAELAATRARATARPREIGRQIDSLNFNHGVLGIDPAGPHRVRTGTRKSDLLRGGKGDDTLQGRRGPDRLLGRGGKDAMFGGGGDDTLLGGFGDDHLDGGSGNDRLATTGGNSTLIGGAGSNILRGGRGSDTLVDWGPRSVVKTGQPRRGLRVFVNVRDGDHNDVVICRSTRSTVIVDRGDRLRGDCGKVVRRGRTLRPTKTR
ncbi:MAG: calcium-binding protein [Solirubrobacterales bacterium]